MDESVGKEYENNTKGAKDARPGIEDIMESLVKITLGGVGGTVIGLSLEKRLEAMKLTTAEGIAAAARRKRGRMTTHQLNLVTAWALSCLVFCSIIESSRLTSPSTWILKQIEATNGRSYGAALDNKIMKACTITVADYSIGGALAGATCSFGRNMYSSRNYSVMKLGRLRKFSGFLSGLALGVTAGTFQAAIDYGTSVLTISNDLG